MRKPLITLFLFLANYSANAQINDQADSLVTEICQSIDKRESPLDSSSVNEIFDWHLKKYLSRMNETDAGNAFKKIFLRLQMKCTKLVKFLKQQRTDNNWVQVDKCPGSTLADKELESFFSIQSFWYIEPGGDTTKVKINKEEWIDYMKDGTYSKLSLKRLSPGDFVIAFVESNNKIKKNLSRPGDKYYYSIISKKDKHFTLCVSIPGVGVRTLFNTYYD